METSVYLGYVRHDGKYPAFFRYLFFILLFTPACLMPKLLFSQGDLPEKWASAGNVILASNIRIIVKPSFIKDGGTGDVAFKMENVSPDGSEVHFTYTTSSGKSWDFDLTPQNGKSEIFYGTGLKSKTTTVSQAHAELTRSHFSNISVDGNPIARYTEANNYMARFTRPATTTTLNANALQSNCDAWQQRVNELEEFKSLPAWYKTRIGITSTLEQCKTQLAACQAKLKSAQTQQAKKAETTTSTTAGFGDESVSGSATASGTTATSNSAGTSSATTSSSASDATGTTSSGASGGGLRQNTNPAITEMVARQNRLNALKAEQEARKKQVEQENYDRMIAFEQKKREDMQQTTEVINGVTNTLIAIMQQNQEAKRLRREEEDRQMEIRNEQARIAREKEEAKEKNIQMRSALFTEFKAKDIPLSSSPEKADRLYYFIYAYDSAKVRQDNITVFVSNVFEIGRYADGTWPFRNSVNTETKTLTPFNEIMHGYYYTSADAEKMRQSFKEMLQANNGISIKDINYKGKPASATSGKIADFWDTGTSKAGNNEKTTATQPAAGKTGTAQPATKPAPAKKKADFWDESAKPAKKDSATKKKSDFWD